MSETSNGSKPDLSGALRMHQTGNFEAAQKAYEAVLEAHPDHADAENLLGVLHGQRGRLSEAMARFTRATELEPTNAVFWFHRGECARQQEQIEDAVDWYRAALRIQPQYKDAFANLAAVLARADRYEDLIQLVRGGLDANPEATDHLIQVGQDILARRESDAAAQLFEFLLPRRPEDPVLVRNLSAALLRQGRMEEALTHLQKLVRTRPDWPDGLHLLGLCFEELGQSELAAEALSDALKLEPGRTDSALALVRVHEQRRDPQAARNTIDAALATSPNEPRMLARLAEHLERVSRLDEAKQAAAKALQYDAHEPMAHTVLVQTAVREKDFKLARERVQASRDIIRGTAAELRFSHAAGRVCEATGEYEDAFNFYSRANELFRDLPRARQGKAQEHLANLQASRRAFEKSDLDLAALLREPPAQTNARPAASDDHPTKPGSLIFLVGLPRSGTTMLERLVSEGPNVHISDERPTMARTLARCFDITGSPFLSPEALGRLTEENIEELRSLYWDSVSTMIPPAMTPGAVLVDKNPMSIVSLPLIARMFPDSPILVIFRDPRDVCLSCFTTEFKLNRTTRLFADMQDTVALYEAVWGLWRAFAPALHHQTKTVYYETLTADVSALLPEILRFCGLDPATTNQDDQPSGTPGDTPDDAKAGTRVGEWVNTASYNSVVEPVHQRAVARWKNFEPFLGPEFETLAPYAARLNKDSALG